MFSSSNNINPFPQLPSSSTSFQVPFTEAEAAGFFPFHHHHDGGGLLAGYLVPTSGNYNTSNNIAPISHESIFNNMALLTSMSGSGTKMKREHDMSHGGKTKPARKDRHSKISTSQGLRDRRVRLSIGISREFFDLQDMLGYDTASKTLEWLLGKSKKDIEELQEQVKKKKNNSSSSSEEGEGEEDEDGVPNGKKVKKSKKDALAKECRAKARERARERTKEKIMCTSSSSTLTPTTNTTTRPLVIHEPTKSCTHQFHQSNPHALTQLGSFSSPPPQNAHNTNMTSFLGVHQERPLSFNKSHSHNLQHHQATRQGNIVQESIVIQRKLMRPPSLETSKGFVDWDISSAIRRSSINNLSTELQMYGKPS